MKKTIRSTRRVKKLNKKQKRDIIGFIVVFIALVVVAVVISITPPASVDRFVKPLIVATSGN